MELMEYKDVICRKDHRTDRDMIRDCIDNYQFFDFKPDSVVLDLGANIGGFAHMCKHENVRQYIGYEADPDNFKLLQMNCPKEKSILYQAAVSHLHDPSLTFHRSPSNQGACSGTVTPNKRTVKKRSIKYEVDNYYIGNVLEQYKPTHLKMDIEGTEFYWFQECDGVFPDYIEQFALEFHNEKKIHTFVDRWYDTLTKDFDIINVAPEVGFRDDKPFEIPELGINEPRGGILWGVDIFLKRK